MNFTLPDRKEFPTTGAWRRKFFKRAGLRQKDIVLKLNKSHATISHVLNGDMKSRKIQDFIYSALQQKLQGAFSLNYENFWEND